MIYVLLSWLLYPLLAGRARWRSTPGPQRIALIQTAKIGDFVCTTPLFREIKRRYPDGVLTVIGHGMNAPLARHNPHIDEFVPLPPKGLRGLGGRWWLVRALYQRRIDTTVCVSPGQAVFLAPLWAGVARRLGVLPDRGGGSYRWLAPLLSDRADHRAGRLLLDTEWQLLRAIDVLPLSTAKEAWSSPDGETLARSLLAQTGVSYVGLGVSSGNKLKEPGAARLTRLAGEILALDPSLVLVLIGAGQDNGLARQVMEGVGGERTVNTCGQFSLAQLPAMLARLSAYVGVDSGITYLAEAAAVPVVDFMGPADADDQRPTGEHALVLRPQLACAPCSHAFQAPYHCATGTRACVDVDLAPAIAHLAGLLAQSPGRCKDPS